jgi:HIV Tat-specific factor 1
MATTWDGKTKYKIDETEDEKKARLDKWNDYLKSEELKREALEDAEPDEIPDPVEKMEVLEQTAEKVPAEFTENLEI